MSLVDFSQMQPPGQRFLQGLQTYAQISAVNAQRQEAQRKAEAQQRIGQAMTRLGPNATYQDVMGVVQDVPEVADSVLKTWGTMQEAKKTAMFDAGGEAYSLLRPGADGNVDPAAAVQALKRYATAFENSGDTDAAKQLNDSARAIELSPAQARGIIGTMLAVADPDKFKKLADATGGGEPTAFQKDYAFYKETFGAAAAAEFAQFGRGGAPVSIPLGNGKTWVGPASQAPGMSRWVEQQTGAAPTPEGAPQILERAAQRKTITAAEAGMVRESLGPNGKTAFEKWRKDNGIRVIMRTGTDKSGRRVIQYDDGTVEYAD